jgi:glycopeptide antibiotics resistance protein
MNTPIKWKSSCSIILFSVITASILYFSWIPDPSLTSETYLPLWLLNWSNSYFNLRTAVPFVGFGFLLEALLSEKNKSKKSKNKFSSWFKNGCIATAVICLAAVGQFFILNRHPDIMDVLFGVLGSQVGFFVSHLLKIIRTR